MVSVLSRVECCGTEDDVIGPRAKDNTMRNGLSFSLVLIAFTGCQGTFPGIQGLNQPGRVPPPPTGSYQVPGSYSGGTGARAADPAKSVSSNSPNQGSPAVVDPWVNQVTSAQNQLKQATDSARSAVLQSTQQIQSQVEQASARVNLLGDGVVQASQVLDDAMRGPVSASLPSAPPAPPSGAEGASGSLSDRAMATADESNAQWRKPLPR